jgi:hypothetical protein
MMWFKIRVISANSASMRLSIREICTTKWGLTSNVLGSDGDVNIEELLDGETVTLLVAHHRDVVEPVEIGEGLSVGLVLDQFFSAPMQQTNMGVRAFHHLKTDK